MVRIAVFISAPSDPYLLLPIALHFRTETKVAERSTPQHRHCLTIGITDRHGPTAATPQRDVFVQGRQNSLRGKCRLLPLESPPDFTGSTIANGLPPDSRVQPPGASARIRDVLGPAREPGILTHSLVHFDPNRLHSQPAVWPQDRLDPFNCIRNNLSSIATGNRPGTTGCRDMYCNPCAKYPSGIQRGASRPSHTVRTGRFSNGMNACNIGATPPVDRDPAIHMLVVDRKLQRRGNWIKCLDLWNQEALRLPI